MADTVRIETDGPDGKISIVINQMTGYVTINNARSVIGLHPTVAKGPIMNFCPSPADMANGTAAGVILFRAHDMEMWIQRGEPGEGDHLRWPRLVALPEAGAFCIRAGNAVLEENHRHWNLHCEPIERSQ